jgi:hypothetical protein
MFRDTPRHEHQTQWVHPNVTLQALELLLGVGIGRINAYIRELR